MQQTQHYQLCLWDQDDRILMETFNGNNAKVDAALKAAADAREGLAAAVAKCGNCRIETFSYTGTYTTANQAATIIHFSKPPLLFFVRGREAFMIGSRLDASGTVAFYDSATGGTVRDVGLTWNGNQLQLSSSLVSASLNINGAAYRVFALYAEDE